jgi:predicted ribosome quality control (RQC) complex YloA/Tae2 family protein
MENFDLLALQQALAGSAVGAVIRKIMPAADPDNSGIAFKLDGPGAAWLLVSPGPLYPCLLPLSAERNPSWTGAAESPSPFLMLLRKYLEGARVTSLRKVRLERIFLLAVEKTIPGGVRAATTLVVELTGKSALLALIDQQGNVLGSDRQPANRLLPGSPYSPPQRAPGREKFDPFAAGPGGEQRARVEQFLGDALSRFAPVGDRMGLYRSLISALEGFGPVYASELAARLLCRPPPAVMETWDRFLRQLEELRRPGTHPGHLHYPHDPAAAFPVAAAIPLEASRSSGQWRCESFPSLAEAAALCREEILARAGTERRRRDLVRKLGQAAKKHLRLLSRLDADEARFSAAEELRRNGELLTAALDTFAGGRKKRGLDSVTVHDLYRPGTPEVQIRLDPKMTLVQNAQSFFRRYRRSTRGLEAVQTRLEPLRLEGAFIDELLSAAELAGTVDELLAVEQDAQTAKLWSAPVVREQACRKGGDDQTTSGVLRLRSADGMEILVGRSARGNDQVTFHLAHPEDFWLHAGGLPGSHVVVRNPERLEKLPPRTLEQAAGLAAHYSRGRRSKNVDVHLTRRKSVKRPKGAAPGLVTLMRFETVLARPVSPAEITPAGGSSAVCR